MDKETRKAYLKEWQEKNKERVRDKAKEYYLKNKQKIIERVKKWEEKNKERVKGFKQRYKKKNREIIKAKDQKYREKNKNKLTEKARLYYSSNKSEIIARAGQWRKSHPMQRKVIMKRYESIHIAEISERHRKHNALPEFHEKYLALARYYNERRREWKAGIIEGYTKQEFLEKVKKTEGFCPVCKNPFSAKYHSKHELTIDHNPPISKAGKGFAYTIDMISPLCRSCNAKKGNRITQSVS